MRNLKAAHMNITKKVMFLLFFILTLLNINGEDIHFYFIQLTDIHISESTNAETLQYAVSKINNVKFKIDFVVITGDMISSTFNYDAEANKVLVIMKDCKFPVYYLPGNNDLPGYEPIKEKEFYEKYFGQINFVKMHEGVALIFSRILGCGSEDMKDMEIILKKSGNSPKILFTHKPLPGEYFKPLSIKSDIIKKKDGWYKLLNKNNIKAIIAGHLHSDQFQWIGNVPMYLTSSISTTGGIQPCFRVFEYYNGKLNYFTVNYNN
jgi:Icc-related predicted phosphoesterase